VDDASKQRVAHWDGDDGKSLATIVRSARTRTLTTRYRAVVVQQAAGVPQQLFLLAHGWGADANDLLPLGQQLARAFPVSTVVSLQAPELAGDIGGFEWFSLANISDTNRIERVAAVLPAFCDEVRAWQQQTGTSAEATAIVGFSQGAIMALESTVAVDGLAGRAVGISGRFASLPERVPEKCTLHLLHGKEDTVVPYRHTVEAAQRLLQLQADVTADVVPFIGHELDEELVDLLLQRLKSHVPRRLWEEAMRDVPAPGTATRN
jgi:phospholipase/carboxylesterase